VNFIVKNTERTTLGLWKSIELPQTPRGCKERYWKQNRYCGTNSKGQC